MYVTTIYSDGKLYMMLQNTTCRYRYYPVVDMLGLINCNFKLVMARKFICFVKDRKCSINSKKQKKDF